MLLFKLISDQKCFQIRFRLSEVNEYGIFCSCFTTLIAYLNNNLMSDYSKQKQLVSLMLWVVRSLVVKSNFGNLALKVSTKLFVDFNKIIDKKHKNLLK